MLHANVSQQFFSGSYEVNTKPRSSSSLGTPVVVTAYGTAGVTATTTFAATDTQAAAYASPYEGYAFGVAQVASITSATSSGATATSTASSSSGIVAATGQTYTVSHNPYLLRIYLTIHRFSQQPAQHLFQVH